MKTEKVEVPLSSSYRLLHPRLTVLVSCVDKAGKANVITLAWSMPVSINPPIVAISIAPKRYSHQLIEETKEFVINIPTMDIVQETLFCGRRSGRSYDKFKETRLTTLPAKLVKPPIIKECVAHLECKLEEQITVGDHTLFIGRVLTAYTNKGIFDEKFDVKQVKTVYHMGGDDFVTLAPEIFSPQLQEQ
ncbi:MAG: flavin reductase family protein [Candidatus Bathyarchaeota archaeon]|nr:flavin reductase family protein [Candidatus Bathyarchaeota archaeon]MDH5623046.1 flavin reductase family protein [Candidatus Bathyarchaeota archaeon]MDH5635366.1 flavin reductase family protein [Candidatus Bathyarchaeota archaeon]MDH5701173.1 flavin reductase family protein [Candidatus Bathyarchaeota archaeon]